MASLSDYQFLVAEIMNWLKSQRINSSYTDVNEAVWFADGLIAVIIDDKKQTIKVTGVTYDNVSDVYHLLKEQTDNFISPILNKSLDGNIGWMTHFLDEFTEMSFTKFIDNISVVFPVPKMVAQIGWFKEITCRIHQGKDRNNCHIHGQIDMINSQVDNDRLSSIVMQIILYTLRLQSDSLTRRVLAVEKQLTPHLSTDTSQLVGQFLFD